MEYLLLISLFIFNNLRNVILDTELEGRLDEMEELEEFEPGDSELQGALVFSEDEDMVDSDEIDDW